MPTPGPLELVIILVIALIILGPGKLPDVGASLGKSIREFRKASSDIQDSVRVETTPLPATPAQPVAVAQPMAPVAAATVAAVPVAVVPVMAAAPAIEPAPVAAAAPVAAPVVAPGEPTVEAHQ
jgi:TatA/E family protein of Tat protein translocase